MNIDDKILNKKTSYSDVLGEAYNRNKETNSMIKSIMGPLKKKMVDDPDSVILLLPILKDIIETSVKNDAQLIKLSDSIQKIIIALQDDNEISDSGLYEFIDNLTLDEPSTKELDDYKSKINMIDETVLSEKETISLEDDNV